MKMNTRKSVIIGALLLLISGMAFAALPSRVSWNPAQLNPGSLTPGQTASFQFTITHTGILPIAATNQLRIVAEGSITPFVTLTQPTFPPVFKRENQVTMQVHVSAPSTTNYLRTSGQLVLQRVLPNGKVKEVWRADALPAQFTFSSIDLPPYPDVAANNATLEGIDADMNDVRDDIDHYIVETYPNSAKVREALKQEARALTPFLLDAEDRAQTRANNLAMVNGRDCLRYVFNHNLDLSYPAGNAFKIAFLNTKERSREYWKADQKLGGTTDPRGNVLGSEIEARRKASCSFDADVLPN
jgi:hypothetical protein